MRIPFLTLWFSFLLALSTPALYGQEQISVGLDREELTVGDPLQLNIQLRLPADASIDQLNLHLSQAQLDRQSLQPEEAKAPDLELLKNAVLTAVPDTGSILQGPWIRWDTVSVGTFTAPLQITAWDEGKIILAPFELTYTWNGETRRIFSNPVGFVVKAVGQPSATINPADSIPIAPIKPIREEPVKFADYLPWILGLLGVIALGVLLWYWLNRKEEGAQGPLTRKMPVHEFSMMKLLSLKEEKLWQQGQVKEYQSQLTYIVREYLENRFHIKALESTTPEILSQLKPLGISEDQKNHLQQMFQMADMVKFAKAQPEVEVHAQLMESSEDFILKTKPVELTQESEEGWVEVPIGISAVDNKGKAIKANEVKALKNTTTSSSQGSPKDWLFCPITGKPGADQSLRLYNWTPGWGGFRLQRKEVMVSAEGLQIHRKSQSFFWKIFNRLGLIFILIPFLGGYLLMFLFVLGVLLSPLFMLADLATGKKPLSRGKIVLTANGNVKLNDKASV